MLDSLHRRRRGRRIAPLLSKASGGRLAAAGPASNGSTPRPLDPAGGERILDALRAYVPPSYPEGLGQPSRELLARIGEDDVAEVRRRVDPGLQAVWEQANPVVQEHLKLIFGVHYEVPGILEKTGLRTDTPPDHIHSMGRGPLAAGGDFWLADTIAGAIERTGGELAAGSRVLDFGCSSGRHLRVLAAWRPDVLWSGCDPNDEAIRWASAHLPGIEFFTSPIEPPLQLDAESLDSVFAVSVWSHFAAGAAERWLAEMHRLIRPGGRLVFTTQGYASLAFYLRGGHIPPEYAVDHAESLISTGHYYRDAFGEDGDWGVVSPEWGLSYLTLEWLAQRVSPQWTVALFEEARIDTNQDLIVLRRES